MIENKDWINTDATKRVPPETDAKPGVRPPRKTPVHFSPVEVFNRTIIVYVTVCTDKRNRILHRPQVHELLLDAWRKADAWLVGKCIVMPDHIHVFCSPRQGDLPLTRWVQFWKSLVSRSWPWIDEQPVWQKSFWYTQLRRGEGYASKWEYVSRNAVRKGLVENPDDWPFQGEMNVLDWHE